jgi:hypothetical protein
MHTSLLLLLLFVSLSLSQHVTLLVRQSPPFIAVDCEDTVEIDVQGDGEMQDVCDGFYVIAPSKSASNHSDVLSGFTISLLEELASSGSGITFHISAMPHRVTPTDLLSVMYVQRAVAAQAAG